MLRFGRALARFVSLSGDARRDVLSAVYYLLRAWMIYRRQQAPALVEQLRASAARSLRITAPAQIDAEQIHWALVTTARWLPVRSDCLVQALAADLWLTRINVAYSFHLAMAVPGEGPADESMAAHAWLEVDGQVISGGQLSPDLVVFVDDNGANANERAL